jgi:hypothetical protein
LVQKYPASWKYIAKPSIDEGENIDKKIAQLISSKNNLLL